MFKRTGSGTECDFLSGLNEYLMEIDVLNEKAILVSANYRIHHLFFSAFYISNQKPWKMMMFGEQQAATAASKHQKKNLSTNGTGT